MNNRFSGKIEAAKFEPDTTIENNIDEIKYGHMKNIDSLDIKISFIKSNNISLYYEYLSTNINIFTTYKTLIDTVHLVKNITIHPSTTPK